MCALCPLTNILLSARLPETDLIICFKDAGSILHCYTWWPVTEEFGAVEVILVYAQLSVSADHNKK